MTEHLGYNLEQEVLGSSAVKDREAPGYRRTVKDIEGLASSLKRRLLKEVEGQEKLPEFSLGDTLTGLTGDNVQGIIISIHDPESRIGMNHGDSIFLVPKEGIVRVPWNMSYPYHVAEWDKRTEVSVQDYIKYSPAAFLEISNLKVQEEEKPSSLLVQQSPAARPRI